MPTYFHNEDIIGPYPKLLPSGIGMVSMLLLSTDTAMKLPWPCSSNTFETIFHKSVENKMFMHVPLIYAVRFRFYIHWNLVNLNPWNQDTSIFRTLIVVPNAALACMLTNPWYQDTSIEWTPEKVSKVSRLEKLFGLERFYNFCMAHFV